MSHSSGPEDSAAESSGDETGETPTAADRLRSGLGSLLLFGGVGLLGLLAADRAASLPINMPRTWYIDRTLWVAAGFLAIALGWRLLGDRQAAEDESSSARLAGHGKPNQKVGPRFERVVLYTRPGCHLCEIAAEILAKYRDSVPTPIEVNIDTDPELQARFSTCVPVVEIDGKIRFRGHVNEILLRRLIEATPPTPLQLIQITRLPR